MLDTKIKQYARLKQQRVAIEGRLSELNQQIKKELLRTSYAVDLNTFAHTSKDQSVKAEVKVKNKTTYNQISLEDLLWKKDLWSECSKSVIDPNAVEQAYYEGKLTDDELRRVRVSNYQVALNVEDLDVQK